MMALFRDLFPGIATELELGLTTLAEVQLARSVPSLEATQACRCNSSFCQSVHTGVGQVARTLEVGPGLLVDVDAQDQIIYVEIIDEERLEGYETLLRASGELLD
jgi:hypothetical protein